MSPPPAAVPPDDVAGRSLAADPSWLQRLLRVLFPALGRQCGAARRGAATATTRYGFRVPAVIVSPYARPDCVLSEVFDHTSVLKLIEEKWNLPALTRAGRGGGLAARRAGPDGAAGLPRPAVAARTGADVGHLVRPPDRARTDAPMSRAAVVVNPTKLDDDEAFRKSVRRVMDDHGWDEPLWLETTPEDPGRGQAESAVSAGIGLVLACGGDGTVTACAEGITGTGVPLGRPCADGPGSGASAT